MTVVCSDVNNNSLKTQTKKYIDGICKKKKKDCSRLLYSGLQYKDEHMGMKETRVESLRKVAELVRM